MEKALKGLVTKLKKGFYVRYSHLQVDGSAGVYTPFTDPSYGELEVILCQTGNYPYRTRLEIAPIKKEIHHCLSQKTDKKEIGWLTKFASENNYKVVALV